MRAVIQRVTKASVTIAGKVHASIEDGLLVFLGIEDSDTEEDIEWLSNKIVNLRIFNDGNGVMNIPVTEIKRKNINKNMAIFRCSQRNQRIHFAC